GQRSCPGGRDFAGRYGEQERRKWIRRRQLEQPRLLSICDPLLLRQRLHSLVFFCQSQELLKVCDLLGHLEQRPISSAAADRFQQRAHHVGLRKPPQSRGVDLADEIVLGKGNVQLQCNQTIGGVE